MKTLEKIGEMIAGLFIGLGSLLILLVGSLFAVGSLGRVLKNKTM
jgi:hypothetical protein